ncbi:DeoR family transcriptional regulator [Enterobacter ludwigii]
MAEPGRKYSAAVVAEALGVSDNTARNDLRTLARENLLTEI